MRLVVVSFLSGICVLGVEKVVQVRSACCDLRIRLPADIRNGDIALPGSFRNYAAKSAMRRTPISPDSDAETWRLITCLLWTLHR